MKEVGTKIRAERKRMGLGLEKLAQKLGVSLMTLQIIATGKSTPALVLLTEIANHINKSVISFLEEPGGQKLPIHIKRKNQLSISSSALKIKAIGPPKMIADNIIVTDGELNKRESVDLHANSGKEFTYIIQGYL